MPKHRGKNPSTSQKNPAESEDYSIYPKIDGLKTSVLWRIKPYGDEGALSEEEISMLAETCELPGPLVQTLSQQLGYCLDEDAAINLVEVNRGRAIERGIEVLNETARWAKRMENDIERIRNSIAPLRSYFARRKKDANILISAQKRANSLSDPISKLHDTISELIGTPGAAADMSPRDKRNAADNRRSLIIETCCYAWLEAKGSLTGTSVSDWSKKGPPRRPLVDFIQMVVGMVTEPSIKLSGETIKRDIDRFKKKLADPGNLLGPPEFGPSGSGNFEGNSQS